MRIGIFGGTFDPPHVGHLIAAADAVDALSLDRVVFIPAAAQPLKSGTCGGVPDQRLAMTRLMAGDDPRLAVDRHRNRAGRVIFHGRYGGRNWRGGRRTTSGFC